MPRDAARRGLRQPDAGTGRVPGPDRHHPPGLSVVGEAGTGAAAVELIRRERPDVALMDIQIPEMDGIEATRRLLGGPEPVPVRVLILTTFDLDRYVFAALRAGASGFLLKDTPPNDLLAAIRVIADGEALLSPRVTRRLVAEFAKRPAVAAEAAHRLDGVTDRGREVLVLIARGLSNTEIATEIGSAANTCLYPSQHPGELLRTQIIQFCAISGISGMAHQPPDDQAQGNLGQVAGARCRAPAP